MNHSSSLKYSYDRVFFFFLSLVEVIQYDAISNVYGNEKSSMFLVFSIYLMIRKVRSWIQFFDIFSEFKRVILLLLSINLKLSIAILRWKLNLSIFHFLKVSVSFKFPEAISRVHSNFTQVWSKRSLLRIPNHFLVLPKFNLFENWGLELRFSEVVYFRYHYYNFFDSLRFGIDMNFLDFIFSQLPFTDSLFRKPIFLFSIVSAYPFEFGLSVKLLPKSIDRKIQRIQHTIESSIYYVFSEEHRLHRWTWDTWEIYDVWT